MKAIKDETIPKLLVREGGWRGSVRYRKDDVYVTNGHMLLVIKNGVHHDVWGLHNEIMCQWPHGGSLTGLTAHDVDLDQRRMTDTGRWYDAKPERKISLPAMVQLLQDAPDTGGNNLLDEFYGGNFVRGIMPREGLADANLLFLPVRSWGSSVRWVAINSVYIDILRTLADVLLPWDLNHSMAMPFSGEGVFGLLMPVKIDDDFQMNKEGEPLDATLNYWEDRSKEVTLPPTQTLRELDSFLAFGDTGQRSRAGDLLKQVLPDKMTFGVINTGDTKLNESCVKEGSVYASHQRKIRLEHRNA